MSELDKSAEPQDAGGATPTGDKRRPVMPIVLSALLVAALALAGFFFWKYWTLRSDNEARDEARQAACDYAPKLVNFDQATMDTFISDVLAGATGDWKDQFAKDAPQYRELVGQGQLKSQLNDVQCAVKSGDSERAEVVVAVGRSISSVLTQGQSAPGQVAMVMTMQKVDGHWLASKVDAPFLGTAGGAAPESAPPSSGAPAPSSGAPASSSAPAPSGAPESTPSAPAPAPGSSTPSPAPAG
ncbi:hypothetical protein [Skermania piniformis]|uniref:Mce-associated membrane protein n=1 Tax=Skermania pinensis TaxID=39122 RepID=A0ABX8SDI3_9ACTN|nr:hypothetical protein [Skermania piniformis]QXQ13726.1 hypothetical protein KV203_18350 [Skermania piniformis]